jgi:hypothetical protein
LFKSPKTSSVRGKLQLSAIKVNRFFFHLPASI